jgi:hypothetical protein
MASTSFKMAAGRKWLEDLYSQTFGARINNPCYVGTIFFFREPGGGLRMKKWT